MKNVKRISSAVLAVLIICIAVLTVDMSAIAADYSVWSSVFDPAYYNANNAEANAYAKGNVDKLWKYFSSVGIKKGDQASAEFNVFIYAKNYPDLVKIYGGNYVNYYIHYVQIGKAEGRNGRTLLNATNTTQSTTTTTTTQTTGGSLNVSYRTQDEIIAYMNSHPTTGKASCAVAPNVSSAPYSAGALDSATLTDGLNSLNVVRYIAGLDEVTLNSEYNQKCQTGCLVNAVNGSMSHTPYKPANMDQSLYSLGYSGTSSSNLGWGYRSLSDAMYRGWMQDSDSGNIPMVGHRRWCLNPKMQQTGFGMVGTHTAMYSFDRGGSSSKSQVAWPAQTMPVSLMYSDTPWTISMGQSVNMGSVKVTLTDAKTGAAWSFYQGTTAGYFNVNNEGYGQSGCIIFRPNARMAYTAGSVYNVAITGNYSNGTSFNVAYTVTMF